MPPPASDEEGREERLNRLIHLDYYAAVERGETPTLEELAAKHPEFADELRSFFLDLRHVQGRSPGIEDGAASTIQEHGKSPRSDMESTNAGVPIRPATAHFIRDYQLLKKLGEGGMGTVYLAVHTQLEKRVAIKVLRDDRESDATAIQRFRKEIKAVGRFEHDHIVRAFDAGEINGLHFLVMEFIDGADLSQLLSHCQSFSIAESCELARQAALGLEHAHQFGLIHRDVKPSNLMLTPGGKVKLLDLGLAQLSQPFRHSTALTADGQAMGTLKYMSPEQLDDSKSVNATCDIYSLGVTLAELLYGQLPAAGFPTAIDGDDLRKVREDVPDDLIDLVRAMTSKQTSQRVQNASTVAERLAAWTDGHDLTALYARYRQQSRQALNPPPAPPLKRDRGNEPAISSGSGGGWLRERWVSTALFIALFLIALAASIAFGPGVGQEKRGAAVPLSTDATLNVIIDPDAEMREDLNFPGLLVDATSGDSYSLEAGPNQVPPGRYELRLNGWLSSIPSPIVIEPSSKRSVVITPPVRSDFPVQFPEIPDVDGAWAKYNARITPAGTDESAAQSYSVEVRCLQSHTVDEREFRWIRIEITSNTQYRETAWLLIDTELYRLEQELSIREGYVEASLPKVEVDLSSMIGDQPLMVPWSDEVDPLEEMARQLGFEWPAGRISTQSFVTMFFGLSHPAVSKEFAELRTLLGAATKRNTVRATIDDGRGPLPIFRVTARPEGDSETNSQLGYTIDRARDSEMIPFSFLHVDIRGPRLHVSLDRSRGGREGMVRQVDAEQLAQMASNLAELQPSAAVDYTRASLPTRPGEYAVFESGVRLGAGPLLIVKVTVLAGLQETIDGRPYRWFEVEVDSSPAESDQSVIERVSVLIDERAYIDQKEFVVAKGWHEIRGEVFEFYQGDRKPSEDSLAWLGDKASIARFGVHETLALLFDAQLPSSGLAGKQRGLIAAIDAAEADARKTKPRSFEVRGKGRVNGFLVEFEPDSELGPQYTIGWSKNVPFGFVQVSLRHSDLLSVDTKLTNFNIRGDLLPGSVERVSSLERRAEATKRTLESKQVRFWVIDRRTPLVGKYNGYFRDEVSIQTVDSALAGGEKVKLNELLEEDIQWILQNHSRSWRSESTEPAVIRGLLDDFLPVDQVTVVLTEDLERVKLQVQELSERDQEYMRSRLRQLRPDNGQ